MDFFLLNWAFLYFYYYFLISKDLDNLSIFLGYGLYASLILNVVILKLEVYIFFIVYGFNLWEFYWIYLFVDWI